MSARDEAERVLAQWEAVHISGDLGRDRVREWADLAPRLAAALRVLLDATRPAEVTPRLIPEAACKNPPCEWCVELMKLRGLEQIGAHPFGLGSAAAYAAWRTASTPITECSNRLWCVAIDLAVPWFPRRTNESEEDHRGRLAKMIRAGDLNDPQRWWNEPRPAEAPIVGEAPPPWSVELALARTREEWNPKTRRWEGAKPCPTCGGTGSMGTSSGGVSSCMTCDGRGVLATRSSDEDLVHRILYELRPPGPATGDLAYVVGVLAAVRAEEREACAREFETDERYRFMWEREAAKRIRARGERRGG